MKKKKKQQQKENLMLRTERDIPGEAIALYNSG